jgi:hypothetical protein
VSCGLVATTLGGLLLAAGRLQLAVVSQELAGGGHEASVMA